MVEVLTCNDKAWRQNTEDRNRFMHLSRDFHKAIEEASLDPLACLTLKRACIRLFCLFVLLVCMFVCLFVCLLVCLL